MLKITYLVFLLLSISTANIAKAQDASSWGIDGLMGKIQVRGVLTESACRLDLNSSYQEIDLGTLPTGHFQNVGDSGNPVSFSIVLRDCLRSGTSNDDPLSGLKVLDRYQPSVTLHFLATVTAENENIIPMKGVDGIGLVISDKYHKTVKPGHGGRPLLITPGQDTLKYYVTPVRILGPLHAGTFRGNILFYMSYD